MSATMKIHENGQQDISVCFHQQTYLFLTRGWEYLVCPGSFTSDKFSSSKDRDSRLIAGLAVWWAPSNIDPEQKQFSLLQLAGLILIHFKRGICLY